MPLFFDYSDFKIDAYQLENILRAGVPFQLFLLEPLMGEGDLQRLIHERASEKKDPFEDLSSENADKMNPIIFLCKTGRQSKKAVKKAAKLGFINIHFLDNGMREFNQQQA